MSKLNLYKKTTGTLGGQDVPPTSALSGYKRTTSPLGTASIPDPSVLSGVRRTSKTLGGPSYPSPSPLSGVTRISKTLGAQDVPDPSLLSGLRRTSKTLTDSTVPSLSGLNLFGRTKKELQDPNDHNALNNLQGGAAPNNYFHLSHTDYQKISDWDEAYSWGNHSLEGYITEETDPIFTAWDKSTGISINTTQITDWSTATSDFVTGTPWTTEGYLTEETDPTVDQHIKNITSTQISNWDTAFGWGDHDGLYALVAHDHSGVYEPYLDNPAQNGYVLASSTSGVRTWVPMEGGGEMIYPDPGIAVSTGSSWGDSITTTIPDNSEDWDAAYTHSISDHQTIIDGTGFVKADGTTISFDDTDYEPDLENPTEDGQILSSTISGTRSWINSPDSMVYPDPGIAVSDGSGWTTSITTTIPDNSSDWDTAFEERITDVSGDGNSTLTLTRPNAADLTTDLSHNHTGTYEPVLGNPTEDGYVLSSTTGGTRSWIEMSALTDESDPIWEAEKDGYRVHSGFINREDTEIYMDGDFFHIDWVASPGHNYPWSHYVSGIQKGVSELGDSVEIENDKMLHFVFYDELGLQVSTEPWDLKKTIAAPVALVYKDGEEYVLTDERHSYTRNPDWHSWAHNNIGATYKSGLAGNFTDSTFSIEQGVIYDEDIRFDTGGTKTTTTLWYRHTGATVMSIERDSALPYKLSGNNIMWDDSGTLVAADSNRYVVNWMYCSNDATEPIYTVIGQAQHTNIADARDAEPPDILLSTAEWKVLYKLIYRNTNPVSLIEAQDLRSVQAGVPTSFVATDHAGLIGRDAPNQHPASAITYDDGPLSTFLDNISDEDTITRLRAGTSSYLTGDITLAESGAATVSQSGSTITIGATNTITRLRATTEESFFSGDFTFLEGDNVTLSQGVETITIAAQDTTYEAEDFDIKDLTDSTSLRTTWSGKLDPGGWYDTTQNTINLSSFNDDLTYEAPITAGTGLNRDNNEFSTNDSEIDHNELDNYEVEEHIDWTESQALQEYTIHSNNYTNTTYTAGDGIGLSGTTFSVLGNNGLVQETSGLALGTPDTLSSSTTNSVSASSHTHAITGQLTDTITRLRATTEGDYQSGDITLLEGDNITLSDDIGTLTISAQNTTYEASDFDIKDLEDEDGLRAIWNAKLDSGGWYDANQNTINLSSFNDDLIYESSITAGTGLTRSGDEFSTNDVEIDHNSLNNYESNEHIDWTEAQLTPIHSSNYENTTYTAGTHLTMSGTTINHDDNSNLRHVTDAEKSTWNSKEDGLGNPTTNGHVLSSTTGGTRSWIAIPSGMVWPSSAGIAVYDGTGWDASITDNSSNWNEAYSWGNHAEAGYSDVDWEVSQEENLKIIHPDNYINTEYAAGDGIDLSEEVFTVFAGDGLNEYESGLSLGTPETLSAASTNNVTSTSHTHAITGELTDTVTRIRGGSASYLTGDVTLAQSGAATISQSGSTITIGATDTVTRLRATEEGAYQSGDITLIEGDNITITEEIEGIQISAQDTTYTGGTDITISNGEINHDTGPTIRHVTDTEKTTWNNKEDDLGVPTTNGHVLSSTTGGDRSWIAIPSGMVWPSSAGIAVYDGVGWATSIADNSSNWDEAHSWGDHSEAGYSDVDWEVSQVSETPGESKVIHPDNYTDTTYSAGNGINLSDTTFTVAGGNGLTQQSSGLALGTPGTLDSSSSNNVSTSSHTHAITGELTDTVTRLRTGTSTYQSGDLTLLEGNNIVLSQGTGTMTIGANVFTMEVADARNSSQMPGSDGSNDYMPEPDDLHLHNRVVPIFSMDWAGSGWGSMLTVSGWGSGYASWQLAGGSSTGTQDDWYLRSGISDSWNSWRRIWHDDDFSSTDVDNWNNERGSQIAGDNLVWSGGNLNLQDSPTFTGQVNFPSGGGTARIESGGGDSAGYTNNTIQLSVWNGIGIYNSAISGTYPQQVTGFYRVREGYWDTKEFPRVDGTSIEDIFSTGEIEIVTHTAASNKNLATTDNGKIIEMNRSDNRSVVVPQNMPAKFQATVVRYGSGEVTIAEGSNVTIRSDSGNKRIGERYAGVTLYHRGGNEWILMGNLKE